MILAVLVLAALTASESSTTMDGRELFDLHCASCHGAFLQGSSNGPPLGGVSAGAVDFQLSTGRMPKHAPAGESGRMPPEFTPAQIAAIVQYVSSVSGGSRNIPTVSMLGDVARGKAAFIAECAACHGAAARGDSVGYGWVAPSLEAATPTQIAEAVRSGPAVMPRFNEAAISDARLADIVAYIESLRVRTPDPGGFDLGYIGPVAEGAVAWIFGLCIVVLFIRRIGTDD